VIQIKRILPKENTPYRVWNRLAIGCKASPAGQRAKKVKLTDVGDPWVFVGKEEES